MILYAKRIVTPKGVIEGYIHIKDGKIVDITDTCDEEFIDYRDQILMPGYIDIHTHGWATGSYWMEKTAKSIWDMQRHLPKCGVTSFLATTGTDSIDETFRYIEAANEAYANQHEGAELLGIHMEGPFISKEFKGLQKEEHCLTPDVKLMEQFYNAQTNKEMIKLMTLAPELDHAKELIQFNRAHGIQNSIGHSGATFDDISALKNDGLGGVTHMFSGMRGFHHRELGDAGSALYFNDLMCEFAKQSGMTVKHEAFDIVYRLKGDNGIYLTTDCQGLAKTQTPFHHYIRKETFEPDGAMLKITSDDGNVRIIDPNDYEAVKDIEIGYDTSVRNMLKHTPMNLVSLSKLTSLNPATYIHMDDVKGSIEIHKDADIIVLDDEYHVIETFCKGNASINL